MSTARVPPSVAAVLEPVVATDPGRELLVTRSGRFSYGDIDRHANRGAHALARLGVAPGDRVAASLPNDVDIVVAFHAAMRGGAVWAGVNRALAPPEKQYILDDSEVSVVVCEEGVAREVRAPRVVTVDEWRALLDAAEESPVGRDVDPFAPAGIAYTSGTTGFPKGVVHSQYNLLLPGAAVVASRGWGPALRKGDCFPLTILNLQVLTTLLVAQAGGCSIVMDRIDAEGVAEWVRTERVTVWNGPPALLYSLAAMGSVAPGDLQSLEEVWTGGGDCPEAIRAAFAAKFGTPVTSTYGLTEAPTLVTIDGPRGPHVDGASGRPLPHLRLRIVDDADHDVAPGETGEICIEAEPSGPWAGAYRMMLGYRGRPDATAETLRNGMLHTGDVGFVDADGFLHVRDRKNLLIIRGGANVYPAEVERVLQDLDGVECGVVFGVPDERLGERVAAAVQLRAGAHLTAEDLRVHCAANLAKYKVPEHFAFVDGFPRNAMGKVQRRQLAAELDLGPPAPSPKPRP
ncbi:MAG TPA: AMP-binding protein [Acidimicrobiales bacterium]|nr:AMP-binding protein [Acidimicrobiales bacterium]